MNDSISDIFSKAQKRLHYKWTLKFYFFKHLKNFEIFKTYRYV